MLSKETTDQIRKEAEDKYYLMKNYQRVYIEGATAWAIWKEKAEGAKAALEAVNDILKVGGHIFPDSDASTKIKQAIEQFN